MVNRDTVTCKPVPQQAHDICYHKSKTKWQNTTIKVNAIESTSSGGVAAKVASINDGALSNRNLLINSSFEINQRNGGYSSSASGGNRYVFDRWSVPNRTRVAQSTDVPAGFKYAILLDREQTGGTEPFTLSQGIEAVSYTHLTLPTILLV